MLYLCSGRRARDTELKCTPVELVQEPVGRLSESLAGRIGLLELHPFERREMTKAARASQMLLGSYPELTTRAHDGAPEWYSSYLGTCLERDVRLANEVGKLSDFQTPLRLLRHYLP